MKILKTLLIVCAFLVSSSVSARTPEPIVNYASVAIAPPSGKALSADEAAQVIKKAAEARRWVVGAATDGKMLVQRSWNGKHTIVAEIAYSGNGYSLTYRDSVAMNYQMINGQPVIHPHYNKFVRELVDAIRLEQMML